MSQLYCIAIEENDYDSMGADVVGPFASTADAETYLRDLGWDSDDGLWSSPPQERPNMSGFRNHHIGRVQEMLSPEEPWTP